MGALIGIAIIAKNEEENLPRLLESIDGAFDRAVLLDTGSSDNTIDVFAAWAKNQTGMTFSVASWEWINDFAAARNAADRLLCFGSVEPASGEAHDPMVDWRCWADCDDTILGARNLRALAENADPSVVALFAEYDYAQDPGTGKCIITLPRERLVRTSYTQPWEGRVHEATPIVGGAVQQIPSDLVQWKHHKQANPEGHTESNERNLNILRAWNADEPGNTRVVGYLGTELAVRGEHEEACKFYREYLDLNPQWVEERAQIRRKLAVSLMVQGDWESAKALAMECIEDVPSWPDSYLTLAEYYLLGKEDAGKAAYWAEHVLKLGRPKTVLIINPLEYEFTPLKLLSLAHGQSGHIDQAIEFAERALMIQPNDMQLQMELHGWRNIAKRERTADTYILATEQLLGHDEQRKALTLLEDCVPYFAYEHPRVVAMRSTVRERLLWANDGNAYADHYEYGGSKPEDFIPDDRVDALCEALPRTGFLLEGLKEQSDGS